MADRTLDMAHQGRPAPDAPLSKKKSAARQRGAGPNREDAFFKCGATGGSDPATDTLRTYCLALKTNSVSPLIL